MILFLRFSERALGLKLLSEGGVIPRAAVILLIPRTFSETWRVSEERNGFRLFSNYLVL